MEDYIPLAEMDCHWSPSLITSWLAAIDWGVKRVMERQRCKRRGNQGTGGEEERERKKTRWLTLTQEDLGDQTRQLQPQALSPSTRSSLLFLQNFVALPLFFSLLHSSPWVISQASSLKPKATVAAIVYNSLSLSLGPVCNPLQQQTDRPVLRRSANPLSDIREEEKTNPSCYSCTLHDDKL